MSAEILKSKTYYYLYKTTNIITDIIYVGVHSTNNINDGYLGSGRWFKREIKKYGKENFKKEILEYFDSEADMYAREHDLVDEDFVAREDTYNLVIGGKWTYLSASKYQQKNEKLSKAMKNKVTAKNKLTGEIIRISKEEFDSNKDIYEGATKGKPTFKTTGLTTVKDKDGNHFMVSVNDPRLLSREIVGITAGCTQTEESNKKRSETLKGRDMSYIQKKHKCEFCGKEISLGNYARWHKDGKCLNKNDSK